MVGGQGGCASVVAGVLVCRVGCGVWAGLCGWRRVGVCECLCGVGRHFNLMGCGYSGMVSTKFNKLRFIKGNI